MDCVVDPSSIRETLSDVGGLDAIKEDLRSGVIFPLRHASAFFCDALSCLSPPRGILMVGPPGTGKTLLAKAIAKECNVPFLAPTLSTLENKYYGESSKMLSALFSVARRLQPCILFFDEVDGMMRERSREEQACTYSFKTEFLSHLDGMSSSPSDSFYVVACTNCSASLDPALRRRLPKTFRVGLPSEEERESILLALVKEEPFPPSREVVQEVASETEGWTGSDLKDVYKRAASLRYREALSDPDFEAAVSTGDQAEILSHLSPITPSMWSSAVSEKRESLEATAVDHCGKDAKTSVEALLRSVKAES